MRREQLIDCFEQQVVFQDGLTKSEAPRVQHQETWRKSVAQPHVDVKKLAMFKMISQNQKQLAETVLQALVTGDNDFINEKIAAYIKAYQYQQRMYAGLGLEPVIFAEISMLDVEAHRDEVSPTQGIERQFAVEDEIDFDLNLDDDDQELAPRQPVNDVPPAPVRASLTRIAKACKRRNSENEFDSSDEEISFFKGKRERLEAQANHADDEDDENSSVSRTSHSSV